MKTNENKVRQARMSAGLSQEEFARELSVSTSTIAKAEAGEPSEALLLKISARFGSGKSEAIEVNRSSLASIYRDALITRLEQELESWKQMAMRLAGNPNMGKFKALAGAANKTAARAAA